MPTLPPDPRSPDAPPDRLGSMLLAALRGSSVDCTRGPLGRAILLLAVPMVLEMAMESTFAICDVWFVSRLGDAAVAAVGLTETMLTILYAFAFGFSMATTALVSRRVGEGNLPGAGRAAGQAILVALVFGLLVGIPAGLGGPLLLDLMGAAPEVREVGGGYASVLLGTNAVILLLFVANAIFRGAGDAVLAMRTLWLANGINLVLDPCLIFGLGPFPELGVTGAAVATTIGRGAGVAYQFAALAGRRSRVPLATSALRFQPALARELLRLSASGVAQIFIATASWVALMRLVSPFGDAAVAGYTIAVRIVVFALLPSWGLANAAATLVGQNLGARQPERAERSVFCTGWWNTGFLGLVMVVFLALDEELVSIFSAREETLRYGAEALRIMSYGYVFYAWGMVLSQAFNGAGDTATPMRINFFGFWLFQVPLAWMLARQVALGPRGVFWSIAIAESLIAVAAFAIFRRGLWKQTQLAPDLEVSEPL